MSDIDLFEAGRSALGSIQYRGMRSKRIESLSSVLMNLSSVNSSIAKLGSKNSITIDVLMTKARTAITSLIECDDADEQMCMPLLMVEPVTASDLSKLASDLDSESKDSEADKKAVLSEASKKIRLMALNMTVGSSSPGPVEWWNGLSSNQKVAAGAAAIGLAILLGKSR